MGNLYTHEWYNRYEVEMDGRVAFEAVRYLCAESYGFVFS